MASHGLFLMYHSQPWFNLNVPWPARVYKICTLKFGFEVRWFHGTLEYTVWLHNFKKDQKCIEPIEAWSIFKEECTPALTSSVISLIAYLRPKNEMAYSIGNVS